MGTTWQGIMRLVSSVSDSLCPDKSPQEAKHPLKSKENKEPVLPEADKVL